MSFNYYVTPAFDQDRRWNIDLPDLVAAIHAQWATAKIWEPDDPSQYMDFTVSQDGHQFTFNYRADDQTLVIRDQDPIAALSEVVAWFLNTVGSDVPAVGFDELEPEPRPIPTHATTEDIERALFNSPQ